MSSPAAVKTGIPRLLEIAGTKKGLLIVASGLGIIASLCQIIPFVTIFLLVKELIDHITQLSLVDRGYVQTLGVITVAGLLGNGVFMYSALMCSHVAAFRILYEIRMNLAAKLARLPMGWFTARSSGSVKKVLNEDVERIELFVAHHILDIVQGIILPVATLTVLFIVDWRLGVAALFPIPLALWAQFSMMNDSGRNLFQLWQDKLAAMNGTIVEYVRGMNVVKVFNQSARAYRRFADDVHAFRDMTLHWIKVSATPMGGFLTLLSSAALFILPVAILILAGSEPSALGSTVSAVFLCLYLAMGMAVPLYRLLRMSGVLHQVTSGVDAIDTILQAPELPEPILPARPAHHRIQFRDVGFAYENTEVLKGISCIMEPGTITALVGPSGSGKSTMASLIGRFWDVGRGSITLGDVDLRDMSVQDLNNTVATVFQDVFLFFDTIEENIRMGNTRASFAQVEEVARKACIHDFILTLPEGYQTRIGEGGVHLSGGEQQRIALARALLKDAPIVVLDEATAYADPENEARIQEALQEVLRNKTVVVIAHRLYTITDAHQILVINQGTIQESGTHESLLAAHGLYRRMWDAHVQARTWNLATEVDA